MKQADVESAPNRNSRSPRKLLALVVAAGAVSLAACSAGGEGQSTPIPRITTVTERVPVEPSPTLPSPTRPSPTSEVSSTHAPEVVEATPEQLQTAYRALVYAAQSRKVND